MFEIIVTMLLGVIAVGVLLRSDVGVGVLVWLVRITVILALIAVICGGVIFINPVWLKSGLLISSICVFGLVLLKLECLWQAWKCEALRYRIEEARLEVEYDQMHPVKFNDVEMEILYQSDILRRHYDHEWMLSRAPIILEEMDRITALLILTRWLFGIRVFPPSASSEDKVLFAWWMREWLGKPTFDDRIDREYSIRYPEEAARDAERRAMIEGMEAHIRQLEADGKI
ncbi:MAG: hypothetical protein P4L43_12005 [Syntrophobacteraceae bacterium]|nr:hypothetical protein [Syntrophobacteraceae bacterium]